jgi:hypothetical protein
VSDSQPWRLAGTYLEACNCDPICPCRTIDGAKGGRSTFGECFGALSWQVDQGSAGEVDLSGMRVVMACRYDDDEQGSPWSWILFLERRADERQRKALEQIWTGALGGTPKQQFPWAWKQSDLLAVEAVEIEIDHTPGRGWFRAGGEVSVKISGPFEKQATVTCVIPGHHRSGREVVAEEIKVTAQPPLSFELTDRCGYEAGFEYSSEQGSDS